MKVLFSHATGELEIFKRFFGPVSRSEEAEMDRRRGIIFLGGETPGKAGLAREAVVLDKCLEVHATS